MTFHQPPCEYLGRGETPVFPEMLVDHVCFMRVTSHRHIVLQNMFLKLLFLQFPQEFVPEVVWQAL